MQKILGLLVVLGCVFGGYFEAGGQLVAIWQPAEMIIILGAGFGAMIIGNPKHVLKEIAHQIKGVISKKQLGPEFQRQLLMCLYELLEMVQNGGLRMLDQHIEQPEESTIFQKYPLVLTQKRLVTFIADNFRLMAMGKIDAMNWKAFSIRNWTLRKSRCSRRRARCNVPPKRCRGLAFVRRCWASSSPCSRLTALSP